MPAFSGAEARRSSILRSSSTIGFSKSSQVPFMGMASETRSEGNGFARDLSDRDGAVSETGPELAQELVAQAHEEPPRADLRLRRVLGGAREKVYRRAPRVTTQQVAEHLERDGRGGLGEVDGERPRGSLRRGIGGADGPERLEHQLGV